MQKYKYIIVEDLPHIAEDLHFFVDKFPSYDYKGLALNLSEAIQLIKKNKPHLVFLDIELNHESGFDLIKLIEQHNLHVPCIIVNSIVKDYAINSFDIDAIYFIDKPYTTTKIEMALTKFEKKYLEKNETLIIRNQDGEQFIKYADMYFIEGKGSGSYIYTVNNEEYKFANKNLKEMIEMLPSYFTRIQKSYIINNNYRAIGDSQKMYLKKLPINSPLTPIKNAWSLGINLSDKY